jgi:type I restriction enzyme S subunit
MSDLPEGWEATQLGVLMKGIVGGGTPSKANPAYFQGDIPFMTVKDLHARFVVDTQDHISDAALEDSASTLVPADTLIVATRMSLGKITRPLVTTAINQDLKAFFLHEGIDKTYVEYLWRSNESRIQGMGTGTTVKGIRLEDIRGLDVPLAPSAEQIRIANQLDTLLTRIQSCNDRLDAIPALLKRFRQTVLDACLLEDQSTQAVETSIQPWTLRTVGSLCTSISDGPFGSNLKSDDYTSAGVQVVRLENIGHLFFDLKKKTFISAEKYKTLSKHTLNKGDLLFSSFVDEEVRVCEFPISTLTINKADCFRLRVDETQCHRHFLLYRLACKSTYQSLKEQVHGATRPRINLTQLRSYEILLPPLAKQIEIVRRVDALFALADRIESRCTAARVQAQRLATLVLAKAFRGELVAQDPQDEPASVLLQRIAGAQPAKTRTLRGRSSTKNNAASPLPRVTKPNWAVLPDGVWGAPIGPDGNASTVLLVAVLKAWGHPVPQMQARLATLMCEQPRLFTAVLPADQAVQWCRLVGSAAEPLPAQVAGFQPATNSEWRRTIANMRARGDLVESGSGSQVTWALGSGAMQIETAGWPDGRAEWVVKYLQTCGVESILPALEPVAREFVNVKAA